jgi:hypothetical protein
VHPPFVLIIAVGMALSLVIYGVSASFGGNSVIIVAVVVGGCRGSRHQRRRSMEPRDCSGDLADVRRFALLPFALLGTFGLDPWFCCLG